MPQTPDQLRRLLSDLPQADAEAYAAASARNDMLTKPRGALGRLEDLALWLASWQGREIPLLDKVQVLINKTINVSASLVNRAKKALGYK